MKPIHIAAILGGAAALVYATKKSNAARHKVPMYSIRANAPGVAGGCIRADGTLVSMSYCEADPGPLPTGYFSSVGALTGPAVGPHGRGHLHEAPCCSGCAQGRGCSG
jgi:hypothetical protein